VCLREPRAYYYPPQVLTLTKDMARKDSDGITVWLDEFRIGTKAYTNLHDKVTNVMKSDTSREIDMHDVVNNIEMTRVGEYARSVREYEKDVNKVVGEMKDKLKEFKTHVDMLFVAQKAAPIVKMFDEVWKELDKPGEPKRLFYTNKIGVLISLLNKGATSVYSAEIGMKDVWKKLFPSKAKEGDFWTDVTTRLGGLKEEIRVGVPQGGGGRRARVGRGGGQTGGLTLAEIQKLNFGRGRGRGRGIGQYQFGTPLGAKSDQLQPEAHERVIEKLQEFKSKYNDGVESRISELNKKVEEAEKRIPADTKTKPSDISIDMYMKWYEGGKLEGLQDIEVSRKLVNLLPKIQVGWLYRSIQHHPLLGFVRFLEKYTSLLGDWGRKHKDHKQLGSVATRMLSGLVQDATKFRNQLPSNLTSVSTTEANSQKDQIERLSKASTDLFNKVSEVLGATGQPVPRAVQKRSSSGVKGTSFSPSSHSPRQDVDSYSPRQDIYDDYDGDDGRGRGAPRPHVGPILSKFMMRKINEDAVKVYSRQLGDFLTKIKEEMDPEQTVRETVLRRANESLERAAERLKELDERRSGEQADLAKIRYDQKQITDYKVKVMKQLLENVKSRFDQYMRVHAEFLMRQHRDGIKYMIYWRNVSVNKEKTRDLIKGYFEAVRSIKAEVDVHIKSMKAAYKEAMRGDSEYRGINEWSDAVGEDDRKDVMELQAEVNEHADKVRERIFAVYDGEGLRLRDKLLDSHLILMYAIKALRFLFVWAALQFAENVFQMWYAKAVYGENKDPPHPALMLLVFIGIEILLNFVLLAVLLLLRAMFSANNTRFPVNSVFLKSYLIDWLCTTVVIFAISALIAEVMRKKKYFRYRYEGERGIRALKTIVFYVSMIILLLPFFRLSV